MRAWHFLHHDMTSGEGNEPAWADGEERTVEGELRLCERGYHASEKLLDALKYRRGLWSVLCRVEVKGISVRDTDKLVACKRKLLWHIKCGRLLQAFVCKVATDVLQRQEAGNEDERSWAATTAAARNAATYAARAICSDAAACRAWDTVRTLTRAADRAKSVAGPADGGADRTAAWAEAWDKYSSWLEEMVMVERGQQIAAEKLKEKVEGV